jgi:hypothetical protein
MMAQSTSPEFMRRVVKRATSEIVERAAAAAEELTGDEGEFYGDERVRGPVEFAAYYLDLLERGVVSHLEVVSPRQARRLERRFERDAARVLGVG